MVEAGSSRVYLSWFPFFNELIGWDMHSEIYISDDRCLYLLFRVSSGREYRR
jgi:hypothetical protein